jgi:hypothetical protein
MMSSPFLSPARTHTNTHIHTHPVGKHWTFGEAKAIIDDTDSSGGRFVAGSGLPSVSTYYQWVSLWKQIEENSIWDEVRDSEFLLGHRITNGTFNKLKSSRKRKGKSDDAPPGRHKSKKSKRQPVVPPAADLPSVAARAAMAAAAAKPANLSGNN